MFTPSTSQAVPATSPEGRGQGGAPPERRGEPLIGANCPSAPLPGPLNRAFMRIPFIMTFVRLRASCLVQQPLGLVPPLASRAVGGGGGRLRRHRLSKGGA